MSTRIPFVSKIDNFSIHGVNTSVFVSKISNKWHRARHAECSHRKIKKGKSIGRLSAARVNSPSKKACFLARHVILKIREKSACPGVDGDSEKMNLFIET